jgi:hypothetical protein
MQYTQEEADQTTAEEALGKTFTDYWENLFMVIDQMDTREFPLRGATRGARRVKDLIDY